MRTYTSQEFSERTGIAYRTLMGWVERGMIQPHKYDGRRRVPAEFSDKDLQEVRLMRTLRANGVSGQGLRKAVDYLRDRLKHNPFSDGEFLVIGKNLVKICDGKTAVSLVKEAGQMMILDCLELRKAYSREKI